MSERKSREDLRTNLSQEWVSLHLRMLKPQSALKFALGGDCPLPRQVTTSLSIKCLIQDLSKSQQQIHCFIGWVAEFETRTN